MRQVFAEKFNCDYREFMYLALSAHFLFARDRMNFHILNELFFDKFRTAANHLIIDRLEFIQMQSDMNPNVEDYKNCFKLFAQYPFIRYDEKIYNPLPHLIIDACTTSLFFRLTDKNNDLKTIIGKEIIEDYVYSLFNEARIYAEVLKEEVYKLNGNQNRTADVMVMKENKFLLIETKSLSPSIQNRLLNPYRISETIDRLSDAVVQIFKNARHRFGKEYYSFTVKKEIDYDNVYGLVITFDESYITRELLLNSASKKLGLSTDSDEYSYLFSNIRIIDLSELERNIFNGNNIIESLEFMRDNTKYTNDIILRQVNEEGKKHSIEIIENFKKELIESYSH